MLDIVYLYDSCASASRAARLPFALYRAGDCRPREC
jgi:hypothetical protein